MAEPVNPLTNLDAQETEVIWAGSGTFAEMQSTMIQGMLTAQGIESVINGSPQLPSVPFEVLVTADQAAAARKIIADALEAGPSAAEEAERLTELP